MQNFTTINVRGFQCQNIVVRKASNSLHFLSFQIIEQDEAGIYHK